MKRKIKIIIEKNSDGFFSAYPASAKLAVGTMGDTMEETRTNMVEALNSHYKYHGKNSLKESDLNYQFDLPSFFHYYKVINAKALGERIGMHQSLLAQYVNGHKTPSEAQIRRILGGVHQVARELLELQIA